MISTFTSDRLFIERISFTISEKFVKAIFNWWLEFTLISDLKKKISKRMEELNLLDEQFDEKYNSVLSQFDNTFRQILPSFAVYIIIPETKKMLFRLEKKSTNTNSSLKLLCVFEESLKRLRSSWYLRFMESILNKVSTSNHSTEKHS